MVVLREEATSLMGALEAFLWDPLTEWKKGGQVEIKRIGLKLQGNNGSGLSMNVEAQVQFLIQQAMSKELLCQMYVGWAPWL